VSATAAISGGHLNPAITCAFMATRRLAVPIGLAYIGAQLLGGLLAGVLLWLLTPRTAAAATNLGTPALAPQVGLGAGIAIEAILTFFLLFAYFGTAVDERAPRAIAGYGVGMVITMAILAAGPLTGAATNPARWLGTAIPSGFFDAGLVYWIGPMLGAVLGALLFQTVLMRPTPRS
jgi:aquaporin Z